MYVPIHTEEYIGIKQVQRVGTGRMPDAHLKQCDTVPAVCEGVNATAVPEANSMNRTSGIFLKSPSMAKGIQDGARGGTRWNKREGRRKARGSWYHEH